MNDILKQIADNPALLGAVKKVILDEFYALSPSEEMTDEMLGQITRARLIGIKKVGEVFQKIANYKTTPKEPERINQAR
jgi:hypothetical protein